MPKLNSSRSSKLPAPALDQADRASTAGTEGRPVAPDAILYNAPTSTCSQKVRLVLAEKGVRYTEHRMNLGVNEHLEDWYLQLNPNGVVPTFVHERNVITDSSVINEYLEEVFPETPLMPASATNRARMRAWRQYIDEVPTVAIRTPSFNAFALKWWSDLPDEEFSALVEKRTIRKHFYRQMGREGFNAERLAEANEKLRDTLERMNASLAEGPWLMGSQFTLADVSVIPVIVRMEHLGLAQLWSDLPRLDDWYSQVKSRPSFRIAFYEGSLPVGKKANR